MKKVVLIGAGDIGGRALERLGTELIAYFVENRKAGQNYLGKPVYPMDKLIRDQGKYLFLLTVANITVRDAFIDQLNWMGIKDFYYFAQEIYSGNIFQKYDSRVYKRRSLYEDMLEVNPERVCILGHERKIGKFVAELFEIKNFCDENKYNSISDLSKQYDYVFVNVKIYNSELHNQLKAANIKVYYIAHYYDCYNFLLKRGLAELAGKYKDKKRCFIIGNGPSLTPEDLDVLAEHNEFCFGVNMIHKIYNKTKWRPNYVCICDDLTISQTLDKILENNSCTVFLSDGVRLYFAPFQYENSILFHITYNRDNCFRVLRFRTELSDGNIPTGWTISYIAMQLAVYMGFDEIYLLGMDNSNLAKHFNDDYASETPLKHDVSEELNITVFKNAFKRAKAASVEYGFKIYNATRGGYLEEVERVNFDELFD